jgi:hypothetical protein
MNLLNQSSYLERRFEVRESTVNFLKACAPSRKCDDSMGTEMVLRRVGALAVVFAIGAGMALGGCGSSGTSSGTASTRSQRQAAKQVAKREAQRARQRALLRHEARIAARRAAARRQARAAHRAAVRQRRAEERKARQIAAAEARKEEEAEASEAATECDPSYSGACLDPYASDYDCEGGSGNGPDYTGEVVVVGEDHYGLDADGDGIGCEPY